MTDYKNARVNVGGLLATTSDIADGDFIAGQYNFSKPGNGSANISNAGSLSADLISNSLTMPAYH